MKYIFKATLRYQYAKIAHTNIIDNMFITFSMQMFLICINAFKKKKKNILNG